MGIIPIYPASPKSHPTTLPASVSAPQDNMPVQNATVRTRGRGRSRPAGARLRVTDQGRVRRRGGSNRRRSDGTVEGLCLRRAGRRSEAPRRRRHGHPRRGDHPLPRDVRDRDDGFRRRERGGPGDQEGRDRLSHQAVPNHAVDAGAHRGAERAAPPQGERRAPRPAARSVPIRQRDRAEPGDAAGVPGPGADCADEQHRADSR